MVDKVVDGYKVTVSETEHYNRFTAILSDYYDGAPDTKYGLATAMGHGDTEEEAVKDLMEQVEAFDAEHEDYDDGLSDMEADAMTLASAGMGTDEDYGYYGSDDY